MGDFLVFHYIHGQHFVVQIYGTSGCQKINLYNGIRTGKKRPRTDSAATSHDELSPETDTNLRKKLNTTASVTAVHESGRDGHRLVTTIFASNIDVDTEEREIVPQEEGTSKKTRVDRRELKEMAAKTCCPPKKLNGKEPKIIEKDGQGYPEDVIGNNKAIKREPADSGDASFPDAGSFSCLLQVDGQNFLKLPQGWPQVLTGRTKMERIIICLKGPDNRLWPVIYHENFGSKVLAGNWALFAAFYGLKPGDKCLFKSSQSKRMFKVHVVGKGSHLVSLYNKESNCTSNNQVTGEKFNEASQFGITTKLTTSFSELEEDGRDCYLT